MSLVAVGVLLTACALCAAAAAWCAYVARKNAVDAAHASERVIQMRGRLIAAERTLQSLETGQRKLWGTVSRMRHRDSPWVDEPPDEPPPPRDPRTVDAFDDGDMDPQLAAMLALQRSQQ
jgi:hypothetical protein